MVAGGHSLLPMMKLRLAAPEYLVDINDLTELAYIRREGDAIHIGALTRHRDLLASPLLREYFPIVADAEAVDRRPARCATAARSAARCARPTRPRTCRPSAPRVDARRS